MKHLLLCGLLIWLPTPWFGVSPAFVGVARAGEVRPILVRAHDPSIARERVFFIGSGASVEDAVALRDRLIDAGARHVNLVIPEMVIVGDVPTGVEASVRVPSPFRRESFTRLESMASPPASDSWGWIVGAYSTADQKARGGVVPNALGASFRDEVITISPEKAAETGRELEASRAGQGLAALLPPSRDINQYCEFLGGRVLVNFLLPESDGSREPETENWSDQDVAWVKQGAVQAMISWQADWPDMDVSFTINFGAQDKFVRIPIGYEPIQWGWGENRDNSVWMLATMRALGYQQGIKEVTPALHAFSEDQLAAYRTQWVYTAFIALSRNVETHRFGGGEALYTAYAWYGGPGLVMPFPAGPDNDEIGELLVYSQVLQHESAHCFWAVDEYPSPSGRCTEPSGYLMVENRNTTTTDLQGENPVRCEPLSLCLMYAPKLDQGRPWCRWSEGHLGVIDANDNGAPDIFESAPEIVFEVEGPETLTTNSYMLRFRVVATAVPNQNWWQLEASRISYAAPLGDAWLTFGEKRVPLEPLDGRWDELEEEVEVPFLIDQPGLTAVGVVAENSVGFKSGEYTKRVYFVGVNYSRTGLAVRPNRIDVSWEVVGDPFAATFNVYRLAPGEDLPGKLIGAEVAPTGPGNGGFVPYRYIDRDVVAGQEYRYYIEGVISLKVEGETRLYKSRSAIVGKTAMIPIVSGEMISHIAPNPSHGGVTLSVQIPSTYGGPARAPVRLATPLDVSVYNVRGQLIRTLRSGSEFSDVLTLRWDGTDQTNNRVPSGVYFVRVLAGDARGVQKVVLIR